MSKYITRVQFKNAEQIDYEKLDVEMEKGRFVKIAQPAAATSRTMVREYNYRGLKTLQEVIAAAYTAAGKVGKQYSLTVMKEKRSIAV
ncbi:MAG TPA: hypothetical protein VHD83_10200 [Puia sp.]|nr:hypothetical protein [Puia sp.]